MKETKDTPGNPRESVLVGMGILTYPALASLSAREHNQAVVVLTKR